MFYSHEVLTSRQYGVATIWLVATLGAKSTLKKVNRKAIIEVNVSKACETIMAPEAPMALRLQSNLLYGVVRVYSEQCNYMLVDVENAKNQMRTLLKSVKAVELEGKHKARPDQVNLKEDSHFILEDLFNFDVATSHDFDLTSSGTSDIDSLLSPHTSVSSGLGSEHAESSIRGINIPPSLSSSQGAGGFDIGASYGGRSAANSRFGSSIFRREEDERVFDPGFAFDEQGNIIDTDVATRGNTAIQPELQTFHDPDILAGEAELDVEMQEAENAVYRNDNEDALPPPENDLDAYPDAQAFTPRREHYVDPSRDPSRQLSQSVQRTNSDSQVTHEVTVDPPALRGKKKRTLKPDARQELLSHDVAGWADNYLDQMQQVIRGKMQLRSNALAKKNADFWVLQNGVGGLSTVFGNEEIPEPLRMFTGVSLLESLTGLKITAAGTKRARADSVEQPESGVGEDGRRVRDRSEEVELGRRHDDVMMEDAGYGADEGGYTGVNRVVEGRDETIEVGRAAQTPLADNMSSLMPWNIAASVRGSSARPGSRVPFSAGGAATSSVGGGPIGGLGRMSSRPGSRMASASPSRGRGDANMPDVLPNDHDELAFDFNPSQGDISQDELGNTNEQPIDTDAGAGLGHTQQYEMFGLAAAMATQEANQPEWIRQTLDQESINFFSFVKASIQKAVDMRAYGDETDGKKGILFETMLPPVNNTRIVATQGFLHVLTLATKDMLQVEQDVSFGPINLYGTTV